MSTRSKTEVGTEPPTKRETLRGRDPAPVHQAGLRSALRANAAFSAVSGIAIAAASAMLPDLLGAGTAALYLVIGVFLVAFAVRLVLLARGETISRRDALMIVAGDWGWVLGSAVVIGMGLLTTLGAVLVGATAFVVGGFAVWQGRHLPRGGK